MKRMLLIALGITASVVLAACGGGGTTATPDDSNNDSSQSINVEGSTGSRTVSYIPGKLNVHFGGDSVDLANTMSRYGYSVEFATGNFASVDIGGDDPQTAIKALKKEYCIFSAEQVQQVTYKPAEETLNLTERTTSFTPLDPFYADRFVGLRYDSTEGFYLDYFFGQAWPMNSMGFNGAWDLSDPMNTDGQVANEDVRVAIIDAGWFDYSTLNRNGLDETILDDATSGSVAGDGTFTAGLAAAEWDTFIAGSDPSFYRSPYRFTGEVLLGILAADFNNIRIRVRDFNDDSSITSDELWNEGMVGINPNATYTLIKTGTANTGDNTWSFSDQQIAASIEHAWDAADCDIILLGMFIEGAVPTIVQTAITNARTNGALVIAPAGDIMDSWTGTEPDFWSETAVDITTDPVWPAAATDCLSVTGTGYNRIGTLADVTVGSEIVANDGIGYTPTYNTPFDQPFTTVASYCNTGADISAMGWGFGFAPSSYFIQSGVGDGSEANPYELELEERYNQNNIGRFSTTYAAAYVAGAASIVFQGLSFVNGTPPTPAEIETTLFDTVSFAGMTGILDNGGYLNANAAMADAIAGGTLYQYEPAMAFTAATGFVDWFSQAPGAVTRGTDLSISPTITNGTAPFTLTVDWGTGDDPVEVTNWNSGDAVTLTGGYDTLGLKAVSVSVEDDNGQVRAVAPRVFVINPLAANITVETGSGASAGTSIRVATDYRFKSNATNIYTGDIGGTPNTTTYSWWFNSDPAADPADSTDANPIFAFPSTGVYTVTLLITEDVRPGIVVTTEITVTP